MGDHARTAVLALALVVGPSLTGCLDVGGPDVRGWWDPPRPSRWEDATLDPLQVQLPPAVGLEPVLRDHVNRSQELYASSVGGTGGGDRVPGPPPLVENARDRLRAGITVPAIETAHEARTAALWRIEDRGARPDAERDGMEGPPRRAPVDPGQIAARLNRTLDNATATSLPLLVGLAGVVHEVGKATPPANDTRDHSVRPARRALAGLADPLLANATNRSGPALSLPHPPALSPLFRAVDRGPGAIPDLDEARQASPTARAYLGEREESLAHRARGWHRPAVAAAASSLVNAEATHRLFTDDVPSASEVRRSVGLLSNASGPLEVVLAHEAAAAYQRGRAALSDPDAGLPATDRLLVPVATADLWPLVEQLDDNLVAGDPVDWERTLDPHLDRWRGTWDPASAG